jgi:hypothetical protein
MNKPKDGDDDPSQNFYAALDNASLVGRPLRLALNPFCRRACRRQKLRWSPPSTPALIIFARKIDPFLGSGSTLIAADKTPRDAASVAPPVDRGIAPPPRDRHPLVSPVIVTVEPSTIPHSVERQPSGPMQVR